MELRLLWTIAERELREALRNKWLWFYAAGFAALAFALSQAGLASAGYAGLGGRSADSSSTASPRSVARAWSASTVSATGTSSRKSLRPSKSTTTAVMASA